MIWVSGVSAALTLLVVLATLRGQRVTNANMARERHAAATTQARTLLIELAERPGGSQPFLCLTNYSDLPVLDVRLEAYVSSPSGALLGGTPSHPLEIPLLSAQQTLQLPPYPVDVNSIAPPATMTWTFAWTDAKGYEWANTFTYSGVRRGYTGRPAMQMRPSGSGPIGGTSSRWQRVRNRLAPYDYWPKRGQQAGPSARENNDSNS